MAGSRKLQYADRVALQQADQAIRKDVLRALVEVITNCNDSYSRLEQSGQEVDGEIIIDIRRRHQNSVIRVRDHAEGMTDSRMDKVVGTYGEATSGLKEDKHVRGMWGRGLKDSIFGLGHGHVYSFKEENFYSCSLLINDGVPTFELNDSVPVDAALREEYEMPEGNDGTAIEIIVSRVDVKMPQYDNLRHYLQRHFELRPIMSDPKRKIILRDLTATGKIRHEHVLSYRAPKGEKVLDGEVVIEGYPVTAQLEVFRSAIQLSTRGEEGDYADGGLLVVSKATIISLTMLKFENDPYAAYFYGSIQCDHLHDLMKNDEPVLTATRDGINWTHPFAKALKLAVEARLEPLIQAERLHAMHDEQTRLDKRLRQKIDQALHELNIIALTELSDRRENDGLEKRIELPPSGIGFVPERAHVQTGQTITLTLLVRLVENANVGATATVISNSPEVIVLTRQAVIQPHKHDPTIGQARVKVEGRQVGGEGTVTAYLGKHRAQVQVQVRSKKEPMVFETAKRYASNALFTDINFDDRMDPRQRVYFDRVNSSIVIATAAPSVRLYLDEQDRLDTTVQGQVLLAELITEAVCREIARHGVEIGRFLAPDGAEADAVQNHFIRLQNQYAHLIHKHIVTKE